jgi:hypothetical protein
MGWASRKNKEERERTAYIVFPSDEMRDEYHDFMKRTRALLESAKVFMDDSCELDPDAPGFMDDLSPHIEKFFLDIMLNYPSPAQIEADLETLKQVRVLTEK